MPASDPKPCPCDPDVVAGLVRGFLAGVVNRVAEVGAGREDKGVAAMADQRACLSMAAIFLGKDPAYKPVGQWNRGGGMVNWMYRQLVHVYQEPEANREALVADVFAWAVRFAYEAVRAHEDDADETDLQDDLPNLADDLTAFMLGVPGHFAARLFL
ncbi:hypothetical protein [Paraburkholderia hospita]|uniref:hypothetical protein n=1 Tax=Paraburkholderia hospita TaxID=169430 RepID=UPI000271BFD8|nr:hypothetical protein [Paraburkholderia hospita]EUC21477.1 hypothetical protein PMI06_009193 [Burkholderia sp. BT03]SKC95315.1 hypothetical protein SAMN06266956_6892 [Paraburkholderia hospita]